MTPTGDVPSASSWQPLAWQVDAHCSKDVKTVVSLPSDGRSGAVRFASGGRDGSICIWCLQTADSESGPKIELETRLQEGHSGFVNSLLFVESKGRSAEGLIGEDLQDNVLLVSGGSDALINVYDVADGFRLQATLIGHEGNVCKLTALCNDGPWLFASASWDGSVRLWGRELNPAASVALPGEAGIVAWSAAGLGSEHGAGSVVATAHSDRSLSVWRDDRLVGRVSDAHTDVVRDLAAIRSNDSLLSVGNDGALRLWKLGSQPGKELLKCTWHADSAHEAFIYSLATWTELTRTLIATAGEDGWLRVWQFSNEKVSLVQSIRVPAQSVWSAAFLSADLLICGCSGGGLFVFSCSSSSKVNDAYTQLVRGFEARTNNQDELEALAQDPSVLDVAGVHREQNVIIRSGNGSYVAWQWNGSEWQSMGDVSTRNSDQRADHIFSVQLDDVPGKPPLELLYNRGENPYTVAQRFIERNDLSMSYLDQVAQFIIKNAGLGTSTSTSTGAVADASSAQWCKPSEPISVHRVAAVNWNGVVEKLREFECQSELIGSVREAPRAESVALMLECLQKMRLDRWFPLLDVCRCWILATSQDDNAAKLLVSSWPGICDKVLEAAEREGSGLKTNKPLTAAVTMILRFVCNALSKDDVFEDSFVVELIGRLCRIGGTESVPAAWTELVLGILFNYLREKLESRSQCAAALLVQAVDCSESTALAKEPTRTLLWALIEALPGPERPLATALRQSILSKLPLSQIAIREAISLLL